MEVGEEVAGAGASAAEVSEYERNGGD